MKKAYNFIIYKQRNNKNDQRVFNTEIVTFDVAERIGNLTKNFWSE
jgi:hypothetical protein